ncbi:MAG: hypothetical protein H6714_04035 [Myxococcales bacterium]|nr:hypothetical protein [Myxococcales bacterium]
MSSEWPGGAFVSQRPAPKTTVVWVLLVLTLLAVTGAAIAGAYAWKAMRDNRHAQTSFAHKLEAETGRLRMGIALHAVRTQCGLDRCAAAAQYFHPSVRETLLAQAPTISERALHVLLTPDLSRAQVLSGTPLAKVAEAARIPPNACIQVRSGQALVIGCTLPYADPQFQILRLEHLETLTP